MKKVFYGLWISKNENVDEILKSGIWFNKLKNKDRLPEQMNLMKHGDNVFLFQGIADIELSNTPFYIYVENSNKYNIDSTLVKVKSLAIGTVKKINFKNNSLEIKWEKNYHPNEWYSFFRQDGIWQIKIDGTNNKDQKKYKRLYDIVYKNKKQDYKWWYENGVLNRKIKKISNISQPTDLEYQSTIRNIILYGSPGVGKTYNTNKLIKLIEDEKSDSEIFQAIKLNYKSDSVDISDIKNRVKFITFHQSFGYEDFIEGFRPNEDGDIKLQDGIFKSICNDADSDRDNNYYLIIDEINRGNISKIFGELITLIEEDKRDTLEVTLPYSKKPFKIPSNLYIIGTMNSTDKSIALIDIALRRRFTFLKMEPREALVPSIAKNKFVKLNKYISDSYLGKDYQIGHSYFMQIKNDDDLAFVLEYKIKPLLEEYFYGDNDAFDEAKRIISEYI